MYKIIMNEGYTFFDTSLLKGTLWHTVYDLTRSSFFYKQMQFNLERYYSATTMEAIFNQTRHIGLSAFTLLTTDCFLPLWPDYIVEKQLTHGLLQKLLRCMLFRYNKKKASWTFECCLHRHEICGVTTIWVEGSWHDLHAHISKNVCSLWWIKRVTFKNRSAARLL